MITSQLNPIMRKSEIWFHHKKRMEHIIIAGKDNFIRNTLVVYIDTPSKSFEIHIDQLHLSYACENSFISKMPGELACKRKDEIIFEFKTSLRPA